MTENSKIFDVNATAMIDSSVIFGQACQNISVGHGSQIRAGVYIDVVDLKIGDYVTINPGTVLHGNKLSIGHNCWIGQYTILDAHGSQLLIGNNCGIGAHSQLWSHMKFGDMLAGCQWHNMSELIIEDDVWLVGHCLVSPIRAKKKSMLMLGGLATRDMEENHVYAGSPSVDITDKVGPQFVDSLTETRVNQFNELMRSYKKLGNSIEAFQIVNFESFNRDEANSDVTYFDVGARSYLPNRTENETNFIRWLLYDKAKFLPISKSELG